MPFELAAALPQSAAVADPAIGVAAGPSVEPAALLAVHGLTLRFGGVTALDGVSLSVHRGEIVCLVGPSGSGKSTWLRLVAGVERPSAGRIVLDGLEVAGPSSFVEPERRRVGMVFQDYALFPHLTVADNIRFGLAGQPSSEAARTVGALIDRMGLRARADSYPHMLSGGERQRVALARALAPRPRILLMDEPFSSLDGRLRDRVRHETIDLLRETRTTTVMVTHDADEAMHVADRIALLHAGQLLQCGTPHDIYANPATILAARALGEINEVHGTCAGGRLDTPLGSFSAPGAPDGAAVACIRPEHVRLCVRDRGVAARVVRRTFLGDVDHVTLTVPGLESPVRLRAFGRTRLDPGDETHLEIDPDQVLIMPGDRR